MGISRTRSASFIQKKNVHLLLRGTIEELRLLQFSATNFKGIESLTLSLDGALGNGVHTLVGLNESGKSTILEAIDAFAWRNIYLPKQVIGRSDADRREFVPIRSRGVFNKSIELSLTCELSVADQRQIKEKVEKVCGGSLVFDADKVEVRSTLAFEKGNYIASKSITYVTIDIRHKASARRKLREIGADDAEWQIAAETLRGLMPSIEFYPHFQFELPETIPISASALESQTQFYKDFIENVLHKMNPDISLQDQIVQRLLSSDPLANKQAKMILKQLSSFISNDLAGQWNTIIGSGVPIPEIVLEPEISGDGVNILLSLEENGLPCSISDRSLGFRWFVAFFLFTKYGSHSSTATRMILLDEPGANLHPAAQERLMKAIEELGKKHIVIYATHSPYLVNPDWLSTTHVVMNTSHKKQVISSSSNEFTSVTIKPYKQFVNSVGFSESYVRPVLDHLDFKLPRISPGSPTIVVEGKADFYALSYLCRCFSSSAEVINVTPCLGATTVDLCISHLLGSGTPFVVLLDGDDEGKNKKMVLMKNFGPILKNKCWLLPEIVKDPKIVEIEDIFSAEDVSSITGAYLGKPSKSKKSLLRAFEVASVAGQVVPLAQATMSFSLKLISELRSLLE